MQAEGVAGAAGQQPISAALHRLARGVGHLATPAWGPALGIDRRVECLAGVFDTQPVITDRLGLAVPAGVTEAVQGTQRAAGRRTLPVDTHHRVAESVGVALIAAVARAARRAGHTAGRAEARFTDQPRAAAAGAGAAHGARRAGHRHAEARLAGEALAGLIGAGARRGARAAGITELRADGALGVAELTTGRQAQKQRGESRCEDRSDPRLDTHDYNPCRMAMVSPRCSAVRVCSGTK
jgi:hypothetical protein